MFTGIEFGSDASAWQVMIWCSEWNNEYRAMIRIFDIRTPLFCFGVRRICPGAQHDRPHTHGATFASLILVGRYSERLWNGVAWKAKDARDVRISRKHDSEVERTGRMRFRVIPKEQVHQIFDVAPLTISVVASGPHRGNHAYGFTHYYPTQRANTAPFQILDECPKCQSKKEFNIRYCTCTVFNAPHLHQKCPVCWYRKTTKTTSGR